MRCLSKDASDGNCGNCYEDWANVMRVDTNNWWIEFNTLKIKKQSELESLWSWMELKVLHGAVLECWRYWWFTLYDSYMCRTNGMQNLVELKSRCFASQIWPEPKGWGVGKTTMSSYEDWLLVLIVTANESEKWLLKWCCGMRTLVKWLRGGSGWSWITCGPVQNDLVYAGQVAE